MRDITLIIFGMALIASGCARPMKLDARRWDVMRPDGTASIRAFVVTDRSLSRDKIESVALCVAPANADPLASLEDLAGACAAGCELLVVARTGSDETRSDDHLLVLRRFLDQRATPPRSVIVIGVRGGDAVATTIANREARVTHLALLAPQHSTPTAPQPVFIAQLGGVSSAAPPRANVTVRHYPLADEEWRERGTGRTIRPLIEMDLIAWLTDTDALTNARAMQLAKRVKANHPEWYSSRSDE
jgi:hypothetical protein